MLEFKYLKVTKMSRTRNLLRVTQKDTKRIPPRYFRNFMRWAFNISPALTVTNDKKNEWVSNCEKSDFVGTVVPA